jgi:hypothetical protein
VFWHLACYDSRPVVTKKRSKFEHVTTKHLLRIIGPTDRKLFFSSTVVQIGDSRNTPFWKARWLEQLQKI